MMMSFKQTKTGFARHHLIEVGTRAYTGLSAHFCVQTPKAKSHLSATRPTASAHNTQTPWDWASPVPPKHTVGRIVFIV